jgi:hypothetical protein
VYGSMRKEIMYIFRLPPFSTITGFELEVGMLY